MDFINRLLSGNFGRRGLPFFLIMIGGSYGLSQLTDIRYQVSQHHRSLGLTKEEMELKGWKEDKTDLLEEYQKMQENMDIDNWENIRGPRPWEDDNSKYIEIIEKRIQDHKELQKKSGVFWK